MARVNPHKRISAIKAMELLTYLSTDDGYDQKWALIQVRGALREHVKSYLVRRKAQK